jgi:hypothetical protein
MNHRIFHAGSLACISDTISCSPCSLTTAPTLSTRMGNACPSLCISLHPNTCYLASHNWVDKDQLMIVVPGMSISSLELTHVMMTTNELSNISRRFAGAKACSVFPYHSVGLLSSCVWPPDNKAGHHIITHHLSVSPGLPNSAPAWMRSNKL